VTRGISLIFHSNQSRVKSSLAALEGEAGGHAKGESVQLQKSVRDLTTNVKLKDAEIQKLRDVSWFLSCLTLACSEARPETQGRQGKIVKGWLLHYHAYNRLRLVQIKQFEMRMPS
jgi:hypothetical protein